jgi:membrane protease YdiL (CAAX protease family)
MCLSVYNRPYYAQKNITEAMDVLNLLVIIAAIAYFSAAIYMANSAQVTGRHAGLVRVMLYGVIGMVFLNALTTLQVAFLPAIDVANIQLPNISPGAAIANFLFALFLCLFSLSAINSSTLRQWLKRVVFGRVSYDPESLVHTTALVMCPAVVSMTVGQLVLSGGLTGLAESLETGGISIGDTVFNQALWIFVALLGVGLFLRRTPQQVASRLGLRLPTAGDVRAGIGAGIALYAFVLIVSVFWAAAVSPEQFQEQNAASEQIAGAFNTIPLALLLAFTAASGEEILFRGALQPVFGLWVTSIFFAALHMQYTLTPASLIIFVVALALGWLRLRYSTTASIIGHFAYNFILLALPLLFGSIAGT